jgi:hypothetical protein
MFCCVLDYQNLHLMLLMKVNMKLKLKYTEISIHFYILQYNYVAVHWYNYFHNLRILQVMN